MADTDLWPQVTEALIKPGVVHRTPKHGRITVDFGLQDGEVTFASLRRIGEDGRPGAQADSPIVISSRDGQDSALGYFATELIQKAREVLEATERA